MKLHTTSSPVSIVPVDSPEWVDDIQLLQEEEEGKEDCIKPRSIDNSNNNDSYQEPQAWICPASAKSKRTINPIRAIVDPIVANIQSGKDRGDGKNLISLALGDPTATGNLPPCPVALEAVASALQSSDHAAGYVNACGIPKARQAIAQFHGLIPQDNDESFSNVIVANGCSGALEIALTALLDPGTILLVPQPGFPLYQVIAESHGASVVPYRLIPDQNWECDLVHLQSLYLTYGTRIRGMVINNPSNPTGAVFSKSHLESLVQWAEQHHMVLVADEVYGDLTFDGHPFYPMAQVAADLGRKVPVITASGLAKQYLLPGWRVGWIVFQDNKYGSLREVTLGAQRLAQVVLGASHLVQTSITPLLDPDNQEIQIWKASLKATLEEQAHVLLDELATCSGLQVGNGTQGAMYSIVRLDLDKLDSSIQSDLDFSSKLLQEENVFVLPGTAFGIPNAFRVVFCARSNVLEEAALRIRNFCQRHQAAAADHVAG